MGNTRETAFERLEAAIGCLRGSGIDEVSDAVQAFDAWKVAREAEPNTLTREEAERALLELRARSAPVTPATDLLAARTALGLTIKQLADAVGYAPETLRRWEATRAPLPKVLSVALAGMMRPAPLTEEPSREIVEALYQLRVSLSTREQRERLRAVERIVFPRGDVPPEVRVHATEPGKVLSVALAGMMRPAPLTEAEATLSREVDRMLAAWDEDVGDAELSPSERGDGAYGSTGR